MKPLTLDDLHTYVLQTSEVDPFKWGFSMVRNVSGDIVISLTAFEIAVFVVTKVCCVVRLRDRVQLYHTDIK